MADQPTGDLFRFTEETYKGSYCTDLLEQYKLYVQSAENVSARRVASSRYLFALNTALVALYGIQATTLGESYWTLLVPVIGVVASLLWSRIIKSHRDLNAVKFEIIHKFEKNFPAAPFEYEWQKVEEGKGNLYNPVTRLEQWIPRAFMVLHLVLAIVILLAVLDLVELDTVTAIAKDSG